MLRASIAETWQPQTCHESREHHPYSFLYFVFHCKTETRAQESSWQRWLSSICFSLSRFNLARVREITCHCEIVPTIIKCVVSWSGPGCMKALKPETHCTIFSCPRRKTGTVKGTLSETWVARKILRVNLRNLKAVIKTEGQQQTEGQLHPSGCQEAELPPDLAPPPLSYPTHHWTLTLWL